MNEREIFSAARQLQDADARCEYLDRACADSPELRKNVELLLDDQDKMGDFLETPAFELAAVAAPGIDGAVRGEYGRVPALSLLGDYRILREIARGGMGVVYEAEQASLGRHVALKVLPAYHLLDPTRLQRFQREAQAAARLHHTHIVPVYGVGEQDGLHYFVMQFIDGLPLDQVFEELQKQRSSGAANGLESPTADGGRERSDPDAGRTSSLARALWTGYFLLDDGAGSVAAAVDPVPSSPASLDVQPSSFSPACHTPPNHELTPHPLPLTPYHPPLTPHHSPLTPHHSPPSTPHPPLTTYLQSALSGANRQYYRSVASIGMQVAEALEYAARQGVLHRDIKPANLLLDGSGQIWVTDFGLAKLTDSDDLTHPGELIGTVRYMAPERFGGRADTRSDIYALGLTLYEFLTFAPAYAESDRNQLIARILGNRLPSPRQLNPELDRDLETVVLKAIAFDAEQRYASAGELADDLRRYLADRPVRARRSSAGEKLWRWCRRNPLVASMSAAIFMLLLVLSVGALFHNATLAHALSAEQQAREAEVDQRERARTALVRAETALYFNRTALAAQMWAANNIRQAEQLLDRCRPEQRGWEWQYLKRLGHGDQRTMRMFTEPFCLACSLDGKRVAAGGLTCAVQTWDLESGAERMTLNQRQKEVQGVAYRPDGKQIASVCADGTISLCDPETGQQTVPPWKGHNDEARCVAYSTNGKRFATGGDDGKVHVWNSATAQLEFTLDEFTLEGKARSVRGVAFSPDGSQLASAHFGKVAIVWDLATRTRRFTFADHYGELLCVAFNPKGDQVLAAGFEAVVKIWSVATGKEIGRLVGHKNGITSIAFSRDGQSLATGSWDHTVKVWNTRALDQPPLTFRGHTQPVFGVAFLPEGDSVVSASLDHTIKVWSLSESQECQRLDDHAGAVFAVAYSPDGNRLATANGDHVVRIWDIGAGKPRLLLKEHSDSVFQLAFSDDGRLLASAGFDRTVRLWDPTDGRQVRLFDSLEGAAKGVAFSPDSTLVAVAGGRTVHVWNVADGALRLTCPHPELVSAVAFSPRGRYLASANNQTITLWDAATGQELRTLNGHASEVRRIKFSPDGARLASASLDKTVMVWDVASGQPVLTLAGHSDWIHDVSFSPDGKRLATASNDWTAKLWDLETGQETLTFAGHHELVYGVAFSPDGTHLASAGADACVRIWDATPLPRSLSNYWLVDTKSVANAGVAFSPDGVMMATAHLDGRVQVRDRRTGWETIMLRGHGTAVQSMIFSADSRSLATAAGAANQQGEVKIWDLAAGKERVSWKSAHPGIQTIAWRLRGKELVTLDAEGIALWNTTTGEARRLAQTKVPSGSASKRYQIGTVSPDGKFIAAGAADGSLHIWETGTQRDFPLPGRHAGGVIGLEFTPDGAMLCSGGGGQGGQVILWDTATWNERGRLAPRNRASSFSLAPDGRWLAIGDEYGMVQLWDLATRSQWGALSGYPDEAVVQVRFDPDGLVLAATGKQGTVTVWTVPPSLTTGAAE